MQRWAGPLFPVGAVKHIWKSRLAQWTKIRLFNTYVLPVLLYGFKTWSMEERDSMHDCGRYAATDFFTTWPAVGTGDLNLFMLLVSQGTETTEVQWILPSNISKTWRCSRVDAQINGTQHLQGRPETPWHWSAHCQEACCWQGKGEEDRSQCNTPTAGICSRRRSSILTQNIVWMKNKIYLITG